MTLENQIGVRAKLSGGIQLQEFPMFRLATYELITNNDKRHKETSHQG